MKKTCHGLVVIAALAFMLSRADAFAIPTVVISKDIHETILGSILEVAEDRDGHVSLGDLTGGRSPLQFRPAGTRYPSFGFTRSVIWGRFRVVNPTDGDLTFYLEFSYPHLDRIEVYRLSREGRVEDSRIGGDLLPFTSREVASEYTVFRFIQRRKSGNDYYLRVSSSGALNLHGAIRSPEQFDNEQSRRYIIYALFYGAMLIMVMYNLFVFISLRDRSYLFYVLYCCAFVLFELNLNGLAYRLLWPTSPRLANHTIPPSILLCLVFAVLFVKEFLETASHSPRIDKALTAVAVFLAVLTPLSYVAPSRGMIVAAIALMMAVAIVVFAVSIRELITGNRAARLYLVTWAALWIGSVVYSLKLFGVLPENAATRWIIQATSLSQVVLLSLALVDRVHFMKENLRVLNLSLEGMVRDRTAELNLAIEVMEKKEAEVQMEFELAGTIQRGILPPTPFYQDGVRVVSYYRSMGRVGGDFYDFYQMKGGYIGVLIADVSGHGMPAAFITALAKISFAEAIQTSLFPADIFRHVNDELIRTIKTDDYVTAFFMVISPGFDVFYCNASHPTAMVYRRASGEIQNWDTNGLFMGAMPIANQMYEDGLDRLEYGDRVLLYTDGITGAVAPSGEQYNEDRLKKLFAETADLPLEEARDRIIKSCEEFMAGAAQTDDMTILLIEIDPAYRDLIEYRELGFKLMWRRRYREAIELLDKALAINPGDEKSHLYLGECCLKSGNFKKAAEHLQYYLRNNEFDANVWCNLARAFYCVADAQNAYRSAMKAAGLKGNFIDALVVAGLSLRDMGDAIGARKMWEKILSIDPSNEIALIEMRMSKDG